MRLGYARVSTSKGEQLSALEGQLSRLQNAGVERIIQDIQSGRDSDRSGYLELLDLVERRKCDEVLVTRVDRLGRDASEIDALLAFAAKRGVRITALDGGQIEAESPSGFVLSRVLATMAEHESRMLSQRIRAGLKARRLLGCPVRRRAPWGYRITRDKTRFEPDPSSFNEAQEFIGELRASGWRMEPTLWTWKAAGHDCPLNSCNAVRGWLENPVLRGGTGYGLRSRHQYEQVQWGTHEPLLSEEDYEALEVQLDINRHYWGTNVHLTPRLLTGLLRCAECGGRMAYAGRRDHAALLCHTRGCRYLWKSIREEVVVAAINEALRSRALQLAQAVSQENPELAELSAQIKDLERRHDPDLEPAITIKRNRMRNLHKADPVDKALLAQLKTPEFWAGYHPEDLRQLYLLTVKTVEVRYREVVAVHLRF